MKKSLLILSLLISSAHAYEAQIKKGQLPPSFKALIDKASKETGVNFRPSDFKKVEEKTLATSKFIMYAQTNSSIHIQGTAIRIWSDLETGELLLAEMHLNEEAQRSKDLIDLRYRKSKLTPRALKSNHLESLVGLIVTAEVASHVDNRILGMKSMDHWVGNDLVREVEVRGKRGVHTISVSLLKNEVVSKSYREFPQSDQLQSLKAHVFPIYEEVPEFGTRLGYEIRDLKYLQGPSKEGFLLQGKYATISLNTDVKKNFPGITFPLNAIQRLVGWTVFPDGSLHPWETIGLSGKPVDSPEELLGRLPQRLPNHDPLSYINAGFDEIQVYYAVTTFMESLSQMGFTDRELSDHPFHAFLYDPDISMKDNAYYYDGTINFTTYSPDQPNLARDNSTIWHELGHGVMDRLMGKYLSFAESAGGYGGLSEGMADFIAQLIIEHETDGADFPGKKDFRIVNQTGFYLTNEFHDDGEAYGGSMSDMLTKVLQKEGEKGLYAFTDLTLETMRLTRNHPSLTTKGWFEHMLYADELGSSFRAPGAYAAVITQSLKSRNFSFENGFKPAGVRISFDRGMELTSSSYGSRNYPVVKCLLGGDPKFNLAVKLTAGDSQSITFPATVKVEYRKGALQGAIKWAGEESNPTVYEVASPGEVLNIPLKASMDCETVNQPDGSCKDYAYIQVFNQGEVRPVAKKRFYLKLNKTRCW